MSSPGPCRCGRRQWSFHSATFPAALMSAMGVAALMTSGVSTVGPLIRADLGLSMAGLGLFAVAVFLSTAAGSVPLGRLADRLTPGMGVAVTYGCAALGLAGVGLSQSMGGLLLAAAVGGAALALSTSVTNGLVARYVHVDHRGRLIATKQMGVQVAQVAAGLALPLAAASVGWRQGMLAGALGVLVLLVPSVLALRTATRPFPDAPGPARSTVGATATARPRHLTPMMFGYGVLTGVCFQAVLFGLPPTGLEELGLDLPVASLAVMALGLAGFAARFGWGFVADRFTNLLTLMVALGLALAASSGAVLLSMDAHSVWAFWVGAVLCGAGFALVPVVLSSAVLRYFPPERVGLVSGVVTASTFLGFAGGPVLFGATVDELGYPAAWWGLLVAGLLSSLIPVVFSGPRRPRGASRP